MGYDIFYRHWYQLNLYLYGSAVHQFSLCCESDPSRTSITRSALQWVDSSFRCFRIEMVVVVFDVPKENFLEDLIE